MKRERKVMERTSIKAKSCEPEELKRRAIGGDPVLIEDLIECFKRDLFKFLRRRCGNAIDAEDALQDTFTAAFRYLSTYRGESSIKNWLYRIASSACTKMRRGKKNSPQLHESIENLDLSRFEELSQEIDSYLEARLMPIREAIYQLSPLDRSVLLLRDGEGLSTSETAVQLGLSESAVKSRLHRARKKLREYLENP